MQPHSDALRLPGRGAHVLARDLRTLLGEAAPNGLGLTPRPQLLMLLLDFVARDQTPAWQEHP